MPAVLDSDPGVSPGSVSFNPNFNSYISYEAAIKYFQERLNKVEWDNADEDKRKVALIYATRVLDYRYTWYGFKVNRYQTRDFPRFYLYDEEDFWYEDAYTIPNEIKEAVAELSLWLLQSDRVQINEPTSTGLRKIAVGSIQLEFNNVESTELLDIVPDIVDTMVDKYVRKRTGGKSGKTGFLPVVRV